MASHHSQQASARRSFIVAGVALFGIVMLIDRGSQAPCNAIVTAAPSKLSPAESRRKAREDARDAKRQRSRSLPAAPVVAPAVAPVAGGIAEPPSARHVATDGLAMPKASETPLYLLRNKRGLPRRRDVPTTNSGCGWNFVRYIAAKYETEFYNRWDEYGPDYGRDMCRMIWQHPVLKPMTRKYDKECGSKHMAPLDLAPEHETECYQYTDRGPDAHHSVLTSPPEPHAFDPEIFSRMEYQFQCAPNSSAPEGAPAVGTMKTTYIEPLSGPLRHPRTCLQKDPWINHKDWLVTDTWTIHRNDAFVSPHRRPRFLFFDMGSTTWNEGNGITSQNWFHALYTHRHCAPFDSLYAWEAQAQPANKIFDPVPGNVLPRYHWINKPASADPDSWDNPLNFILQEATPEDYVVLKLDIDMPLIEQPIIATIMKTPELHALVDELFFEDHVILPMLRDCCWGIPPGEPRSMRHSCEMFRQLRESGIRAHSWI